MSHSFIKIAPWSVLGLFFFLISCENRTAFPFASSLKNVQTDSLAHKLASSKEVMKTNPSEALELALGGLEAAKTSGSKEWELKFSGQTGEVFRINGQVDNAILYTEDAINLAAGVGDSIQYAKWMAKRGYLFSQKGKVDKASKDLPLASFILERQMDKNPSKETAEVLVDVYLQLAIFLSYSSDFEQADLYFEKTAQLLNRYQDQEKQGKLLSYEAWNEVSKGESDWNREFFFVAIDKYRKSNAIYLNQKNILATGENYGNIAYAFDMLAAIEEMENGNGTMAYLDSSKYYMEENLRLARQYGQISSVISSLQNLATHSMNVGEYLLAIQQINESITRAGEINSVKDSAFAYWIMSEIYEEIGNTDSAIWYLRNYEDLSARFRQLSSQKEAQFAMVQFQTAKKEQERLKLSEERLRLLNYLAMAGIVLLILFGVSAYYYQGNKNQKKQREQQSKINQQLVIDLMKEQEIESLNANLEGQEKERTRIAKELHDSLGGTLAATKLSLGTIKNNLDEEGLEKYQKTKDLLQQAYNETRNLSHQMMALPLKRLGFEASVEALCKTIDQSDELHVSFISKLETELSLSSKQKINLYRILQELLQNVIKHAHATSVRVELLYTSQGLSLIVQDNGKGFPESSQGQKYGMGLSNIKERVKGLRGKLDIQSKANQGSKVSVFLNSTEIT